MHCRGIVAIGLAAAAACGGEVGFELPDPPDPPALCAAKHLAPWSRGQLGVGGAVTFNEVMYHPAGLGPEWIELYNPLAFDFDVSEFRVDGAVHHTFAAGARVPAGGTLVIASSAALPGAAGVFTGQLPDAGGTIELWNNAGRLMDAVSYRDAEPWPAAADGSGSTLAKRIADSASGPAEAWTASAVIGGTPGAHNLPAGGGAVGVPEVPPGLAFSEIAGASADDFWIELANLGATPLDVGGRVIVSTAGGEHVLASRTLGPGELVLLPQRTLGFGAAAGDKLVLQPPDRTSILDGVGVAEVARGRRAPAHDWRYPDVATPGQPNVFIVHDEVVIDELMYHAPPVTAADGTVTRSPLEWIELHNRSADPVDVGGWQLVDAVAYEFPLGTVIAAGGFVVVTSDVAAFAAAYPGLGPTVLGELAGGLADSGDHVVLRDACANPVDDVRYVDGGRWPAAADGNGSSLELRDLDADRAAAEAWAASDEAGAAWQTITYEAVVAASPVGPDGVWHELVIGLLEAGVVLVDDISVIVDPATAPLELIGGGNFEGAATAYRLRGNHRHSQVIVDPTDPGNHVLRLVATGPTEHMHNHVETTLTGGHRITNGRTYKISLRARWQSGSNLLNTRLYFNRLARTTTLAVPRAHGTPGAVNSQAVANLGPTYRDLRHQPAVPQANQPVEVSVIADDPDGVAGLTLIVADDGRPPESIAMTAAGGGRYTATVPGRAASAIVGFHVAGTDSAGAASTFPAAGPASRALWKVDDGQAATNGLHNLRIVMTAADAAWLLDARNLMSNDLVGATVIYDERDVTYDVGVRLKGSQRGRPQANRIGFGLRFPPDRPFRGIHRGVLLDRSQGVGYGQREVFFFQAMNRAGAVPTQYDDLVKLIPPRADLVGPAHLQLARFGDLMLDAQFADGGDGDLFEYELIYYPTTTDNGTPTGAKLPAPDSVVGTAIRDLGSDEEAYRYDFIIKANRWRDDYRGLIRFARTLGQSGAAFDAQVADVIDVDQWLRAFAFATLSGAIDNYASNAAHNAEFYLRPGDGRALYFPHDLDFLGGPTGPVVGSGDLQKLLAVPARARAYYGHLHDIITTSFNGAYMAPWADQMGRLLPAQNFAGHLQYIVDRAAWVMNGAPNAITRSIPRVDFAITTNGGADLGVTTPAVVLDGAGWIDLHELKRTGAMVPLALTWTTTSAWRATIDLTCGVNSIRLDASDRRGQLIATDSIAVTRSGAGCP